MGEHDGHCAGGALPRRMVPSPGKPCQDRRQQRKRGDFEQVGKGGSVARHDGPYFAVLRWA